MLINTKELYGRKLAAKDGEIGHVRDLYFDDTDWAARYVVVDAGTWLEGRLVLLSPHAFGRIEADGRAIPVQLNRERIEKSPSFASHVPISRQYEREFFQYYGWPAYWQGGPPGEAGVLPVVMPVPLEPAGPGKAADPVDSHLQGARSLEGFRVQAVDGPVGEVKGFMLDANDWSIRDVVADAGHWYAGRTVRIPVGEVERIGFDDSCVFVRLTKEDIRNAGDNEAALPANVPRGAVKIRD
jgi:hypothetical protein